MTTVLDALAAVARCGAVLSIDDAGRLVLDPARRIEEADAELIRRHRRELAFTVVGRSSGHAWFLCPVCGEVQMLKRDRAGRACSMTAGCKGRVEVAEVAAWRHPPTPRGDASRLRESATGGFSNSRHACASLRFSTQSGTGW